VGGKKENKLGMRASETAEMIFDNVRIPIVKRMGEIGAGFKAIYESIGWWKNLYSCIYR
jgi:alkylation response protein AidB-like acyl-CoA dehydrogenase